MLMPLVINGEMWVKLIDDAALANKMLAVFWQQEPQETEEPSEQSFDMQMLSQTGAIAQIARMSRMPDGTLQILLQGQTRARLGELVSSEPYPVAHVQPLEEPQEETTEIEALARTVLTTFQQIIHSSQALPDELASAAANVPTPAMLADMVAANLSLKPEQQQSVCDALDVVERLRLIIGYLEREREIMEIGQKAQVEMSKTQREYVLRQQLEAIKRELGETDDVAAEANELRRRMEEAGLPEEPRKEA
jgi:ATP-dependent Lon protease